MRLADLNPGLVDRVAHMSPATIDRLLAPYRALPSGRGRSLTRPGSLLRSQVPIKTFADWSASFEQSLLYLLAANAGRVVTREEILDTLRGVDYVAESNVVDRHIQNLRARPKDDWRQPRFIATAPGRGYRFLPTFH